MTEQQTRLSELTGEMNEIMRNIGHCTARKAHVQAEIDAIEKAMQEAHKLTDEQRAIRDHQGGCLECGDD